MSRVALIRCQTYDYPIVKAAIEKGLELLGGPQSFAQPGEKILLKPNMLAGDPPEKCTTTHPAVFKAVAAVFKQAGIRLVFGDSPGLGSSANTAKKTGLAAAAQELQIDLADFENGEEVFFADGVQNKKFIIAKGVLSSNGLISLPKLKTHGLMRFTGSVKNQFGCIPGLLKGEQHVKMPNPAEFGRMLVDLNNFLKPRLFIMDGIMAMEGNGPRGGRPKQLNVLLFSSDPVALDAIACQIINLKPEYVPTNVYGQETGLGTFAPSEIELLGDDISTFISPDFDVVKKSAVLTGRKTTKLLDSLLVQKPYIAKENCIKCGICVNACPVTPKVLDWHKQDKDQPPDYDYDRCIKCYCCQEMCPEQAIKLNTPILRRMFGKKS